MQVQEKAKTVTSKIYWQSQDIRLRAMREEDLDIWLQEEHTDEEGVRFLNCGISLPKSELDAKAFAESCANFKNKNDRIMFTIETLAGEVVGGINLHSMDKKNGTFETGSRIYQAYRGRGYFFQAKVMVLRYAFYEMRFQKYNIHCLANNKAMLHHAKRLGCKLEGRIRRQIYTRGRYFDDLIFGLTREEFDDLNQYLESEENTEKSTSANTGNCDAGWRKSRER